MPQYRRHYRRHCRRHRGQSGILLQAILQAGAASGCRRHRGQGQHLVADGIAGGAALQAGRKRKRVQGGPGLDVSGATYSRPESTSVFSVS